MKKKIKVIFILIIIAFITFNTYKLFIKEHNVTYKVDGYTIKEHFYKTDFHYYDFIIKKKNETFIYTLNKNLNKNKKVINEVKTIKKNNVSCIVISYKKDIEEDIHCRLDNVQVSNFQLLNNEDYKSIIKKAKKYTIKLPSSNDTKTNYKKITIYKNNIEKDNKYIIWDYKGIYIISKEKALYKKILNYDLYDNIMSTVVDKFFVLFENTSVKGIEKIYYYDLEKNKLKLYKPKEKLSKESYINGVINNYIYVTDKRNKKEYRINIKKEKIEEIDSNQTKYIVYENGKEKELTKSNFFMEEKYFPNEYISNHDISKSSIIKERNYYYYLENDKFYKMLDKSNNKVLLFKLDNISDYYIHNGEVILVKEDIIYSYKDNTGLRKILKSNELKYNYNGIYKNWKK